MSEENILINIDDNYLDNYLDNNEDNIDGDNNANDLKSILKEINDMQFDINSELYYNSILESDVMAKMMDYDLNYNVKQLLLICEYYGIQKQVKNNKLKKQEIISFLLQFEESDENSYIVYKRKQLWYFMSELKNDKFMKKYLLW